MATSAYTRARGQRASQMSRQSQSAGRCPAVHRCTLLGQHFHYAHLHCFLMNWLAKEGGEKKEILLAATKQVRSRLYHRGCFKVIFFRLNINQIRLQLRITPNSIWKKQAGSPLTVYSNSTNIVYSIVRTWIIFCACGWTSKLFIYLCACDTCELQR